MACRASKVVLFGMLVLGICSVSVCVCVCMHVPTHAHVHEQVHGSLWICVEAGVSDRPTADDFPGDTLLL